MGGGYTPLLYILLYLSFVFFYLKLFVVWLFGLVGSLVSFSFGFRHSWFDREVTNVVFLLSSIGEFDLGLGGEMFVFGVPFLWRNSLVNPSFAVWSSIMSVFSALWRIKISRNKKFFTWQVLHGRVNNSDRFWGKCPVSLSCCILGRKPKEDLDHIIWKSEFLRFVWNSVFQIFNFLLVRHKDNSDIIRKFLLHLPFCERVSSYGLLGLCYLIQHLEVWKGS